MNFFSRIAVAVFAPGALSLHEENEALRHRIESLISENLRLADANAEKDAEIRDIYAARVEEIKSAANNTISRYAHYNLFGAPPERAPMSPVPAEEQTVLTRRGRQAMAQKEELEKFKRDLEAAKSFYSQDPSSSPSPN